MRLLVESVVRSLGFEVTAVSDGAHAQSRIFAERPDLLVLDFLLPMVGGQVLVGTLKAINRDAKVIAVSGVDGITQREALGAGADVFLPKPFARADLERVMSELYQ